MSLRNRFYVIFANQGIQALVHLLMLMGASRFLVAHDYGVYRKLFLVYELSVAILALGIHQSVYLFITKAQDKRRLLLKIGVLLAMASFVGVPLLIHVVGGVSADVARALGTPAAVYSIVPLTFLSLLLPVCIAFALDAGIQKGFVVRNILMLLLSLASFTTIGFLAQNFAAVFYVRVITGGLTALVLIGFTLSKVNATENGESGIPWREIASQSLPLGAAGMLGILSQHMDKLVVVRMIAPPDYAVYANGAMEVPFLAIVTGSIMTVALLEMTRSCQAGNSREAVMLLRTLASRTSLVLFPAAVICFILAPEIMVVLFGPGYELSATPFRSYLLLIPVRVVQYGPVLIALGMASVVWKRSAIEAILVPIAVYVSVKVAGYSLAALGLVIVVYVWSVPYNLMKICSATGVPPNEVLPWRDLARVAIGSLLPAAPVILVNALVSLEYPVVRLLLGILIYAIFLVASFLALRLVDASTLRLAMGQIKAGG